MDTDFTDTLGDLKAKLKTQWDENPAQVMMAAAALATAAAKFLDMMSSVRSRNAYARQINRAPRVRR